MTTKLLSIPTITFIAFFVIHFLNMWLESCRPEQMQTSGEFKSAIWYPDKTPREASSYLKWLNRDRLWLRLERWHVSHLLNCGQLFLELQTLPLIDRVRAKKDHPYQQKCDRNWWEQHNESHRHSVTMVTCTRSVAHKPAEARRETKMWQTNRWRPTHVTRKVSGWKIDSLQSHGWDSNRQASCQLTAEGITGDKQRLQVLARGMSHSKVIHYIREHGPVADTEQADTSHVKSTCRF